jgi:hypothetical protein
MEMQVIWNVTLCTRKIGKSLCCGVIEVTDVSNDLTCLRGYGSLLPRLLKLLYHRSRWDKVKRVWLIFGVCRVRFSAATLTLVVTEFSDGFQSCQSNASFVP